MKRILLSLCAAAVFFSMMGCAAPGKPSAASPPPTPTPGILSRVNPNVIEETETYVIERLPKKDYIRVDDRHIRHPLIPHPAEFFKEDADYYYVHTPKALPGETVWNPALQARSQRPTPNPSVSPTPAPAEVLPSEFADLFPPRVAGRIRLEEVADSGLPKKGLWRSSFVLADMNGDRVPDIVAPPARLSGDAKPQVFLGDGKGKFTRWPLSFREEGKLRLDFSVDYGAVAVGDIDADGSLDIVTASHGFGLVSLFGNGKGEFEVVRKGLPARDFSSQAITLLDADGDGKLDIVASRDIPEPNPTEPFDRNMVRLYLSRGRAWEFRPNTFVGAAYSNSLHPWDYAGDGRKGILTGSHYFGALTFLWKNEGDGSFSQIAFPEIEYYTYHFATVPGTFGKERAPAFAGAYYKFVNQPEIRKAAGINLYRVKDGVWSKRPVWREKDGASLLYALGMGDLDGDGLDDILFPDSERKRLRIFFQQADGSFRELEETKEPVLDSPGQCVRVADLNGDGRMDVVLSKTVTSGKADDPGGWSVYLNRG